jgi:hypothetical protein
MTPTKICQFVTDLKNILTIFLLQMIYGPSCGKMMDKEQCSDRKDNGHTKWQELACVSNCGNLLVTKEEMVEEDRDLQLCEIISWTQPRT